MKLYFDLRKLKKKICEYVTFVPFRFNQFESRENWTCANHEIIFGGSAQKSFCMYILHTLISYLKILPVLVGIYNISRIMSIVEECNSDADSTNVDINDVDVLDQ